jgi:hypothetical protein
MGEVTPTVAQPRQGRRTWLLIALGCLGLATLACCVVLLSLGGLFYVAGTAGVDSPNVELLLEPSSISVRPDEEFSVRVIFRNLSAERDLAQIQLLAPGTDVLELVAVEPPPSQPPVSLLGTLSLFLGDVEPGEEASLVLVLRARQTGSFEIPVRGVLGFLEGRLSTLRLEVR